MLVHQYNNDSNDANDCSSTTTLIITMKSKDKMIKAVQ